MSAEGVPCGAAAGGGNVYPKEKAGRAAPPSPAPHAQLQPCRGAPQAECGRPQGVHGGPNGHQHKGTPLLGVKHDLPHFPQC